MVRELKSSCQTAAPGQVLAQAKQLALAKGRDLMRTALQAVLNQQAQGAEKRGRRAAPAPAATLENTRAEPSGRSSPRPA